MLIKLGVRGLDDVHPAMQRVFMAVPVAWDDEEPVITSCREGTHMDGSLHYFGKAMDFRLPSAHMQNKIGKLKQLLGDDFDVVRSTSCIHVEYDPK